MDKSLLRSGFTTGTCAAAAAKAAAVMLLTGKRVTRMELMTPKGVQADLEILNITADKQQVSCAVKKDAGDDPDVTHGALVYTSVSYIEEIKETYYQSEAHPWIYLTGSKGIGIVTREGLACPVGKAAINPVPRRMIMQAVGEICDQIGLCKKLLIDVSIPDGEELAFKTFNPKLGIVGGISILGTSGVVEPMSEKALLDTIKLEIHMKAVEGCRVLVLTPGNYGETCLKDHLGISLENAVKCSNFIYDSIKVAADEGIGNLLLVGHIGKLIKAAGGVKNTHSKYGDRRMEILWECTQTAMNCLKAPPQADKLKEEILGANTTEEAAGRLIREGLSDAVIRIAVERIKGYAKLWGNGKLKAEVVTFSNVYGILGMTEGADRIIASLSLFE